MRTIGIVTAFWSGISIPFKFLISPGAVERDTGQRRAHLQSRESSGAGGALAGLQNHAGDASSRPVGMNEEGANLRRVAAGIEQRLFAPGTVSGAVADLAFTPPAATCDVRLRLVHL